MCGRYAVKLLPGVLEALLGWEGAPSIPERYNVAPTQDAPVVRASLEDGLELVSMRWGLVPYWAEDARIGSRMINARSESAADKRAFRDAFRRRRCVVPASGFFEWKDLGGRKQPYYVTRPDEGGMLLAGLWERWKAPAGETLRSFTILTTAANATLAPLHDRMPALLDRDAAAVWLDRDLAEATLLQELLRPAPDAGWTAYPVDPRVNSPANDDPRCLERVAEPNAGGGQRTLFD